MYGGIARLRNASTRSSCCESRRANFSMNTQSDFEELLRLLKSNRGISRSFPDLGSDGLNSFAGSVTLQRGQGRVGQPFRLVDYRQPRRTPGIGGLLWQETSGRMLKRTVSGVACGPSNRGNRPVALVAQLDRAELS